ncbi:mechanosensitive ion channel family protein [Actinoplanes oblitus]|uniref:Mechanosensitive ion channel family protein n=2 Tax=Actinoplanes oblitus TaxID=3040509 RepID=A0ABY8WHV4_9ACTN|nr:mechanosensitive ion channel family protein [Actinoplanes oblitus]
MLTGLLGIAATRSAAREVQRVASAKAGDAAGTPLRFVVLLVGYFTVAVSVCDLAGIELRQLLVGGAITGVVLGLAAQPVLSNLFAGLVLLFARPYVPGQRIRVMNGSINGPHIGTIFSAGLLYTVLETDEGPLNVPNAALLAAAVGPSQLDAQTPSGEPVTTSESEDAESAGLGDEDIAVIAGVTEYSDAAGGNPRARSS